MLNELQVQDRPDIEADLLEMSDDDFIETMVGTAEVMLVVARIAELRFGKSKVTHGLITRLNGGKLQA